MTNNDKMRSVFEAWFEKTKGFSYKWNRHITQNCEQVFDAWKACYESRQAEIDELVKAATDLLNKANCLHGQVCQEYAVNQKDWEEPIEIVSMKAVLAKHNEAKE